MSVEFINTVKAFVLLVQLDVCIMVLFAMQLNSSELFNVLFWLILLILLVLVTLLLEQLEPNS